jgi:threonine dehydrogenase-like Zn-dependent dehydrogenase
MRAAVMRDFKIIVDTLPDPEPQQGEVLVRTLACGICGSDLHALKYAEQMAMTGPEGGIPFPIDPQKDLVMGHEFCAEILEYGPETKPRLKPGTRVVSVPILPRGGGFLTVGYSNEVPGGYGELMVLAEPLLVPVPDRVTPQQAALTEPIGVGLHAVARAGLEAGDSALVLGCGPVGLAVIAALRLREVEPIVAADFSPLRRSLAESQGAHLVIDPAERSAFEAWSERAAARPLVVFECVGVPGILQEIIREAPPQTRVVVAGVCMEEDRIQPLVAAPKELSFQFVFGYAPDEFVEALQAIADGRIEVDSMITGQVGLDGVAQAFGELGQPDRHAKILVEPSR